MKNKNKRIFLLRNIQKNKNYIDTYSFSLDVYLRKNMDYP